MKHLARSIALCALAMAGSPEQTRPVAEAFPGFFRFCAWPRIDDVEVEPGLGDIPIAGIETAIDLEKGITGRRQPKLHVEIGKRIAAVVFFIEIVRHGQS